MGPMGYPMMGMNMNMMGGGMMGDPSMMGMGQMGQVSYVLFLYVLRSSILTVHVLNKPHLLSLTQHRFILILIRYLRMYATSFGLYVFHP